MQIYFYEVGKPARLMEIENELEPMQELVGGYIETVTISGGYVIVCDEDGKWKSKKPNAYICTSSGILDILVGDFFVCKVDGCEFASISEEDIPNVNKYIRRVM